MRLFDISTKDLELDLAKARPATPIGAEKIWGGTTYVKTPNGWKPKTKGVKGKGEDPSQGRRLKQEESPTTSKEKQIEEFASKAKDSQLESAIKDPKQEESVKKIAKEELEKRKVELTEDLDKKKKETELKVIKKTGIVADGHKMFITMNEDNTGYTSKGYGLNLKSEEGEDLSSFKKRVKETLENKFKEKSSAEDRSSVKTELNDGLDRKLSEEDSKIKAIKKTSVVVDGHKMFITMNEGNTGYKAKGYGLSLKTEEGETLKDFKERVKSEMKAKSDNTKKELKKEEQPTEKKEEKSTFKEQRKEIVERFDKTLEKYEKDSTFRQSLDESYTGLKKDDKKMRELAKESKLNDEQTKEFLDTQRGHIVSKTNATGDLTEILAVNKMLVEDGELPYCNPLFYSEFEGENYRVFRGKFYKNEDAQNYFNKQRDLTPERNLSEKESFDFYIGTGYDVINQYLLTGKIDKDLIEDAIEDGDHIAPWIQEGTESSMNEVTKTMNDYIDKCPPISENVILSRRVEGKAIESIINDLKVGDKFEMKSFQSFSLMAIHGFGDLQITLIAPKGTKGIAPIGDKNYEMEYLMKSGSKVRVIEKGFNSMTIELL